MFTTKNFFTLVGKHILIAFVALSIATGSVIFLSGQITKVSTRAIKDRHLATILSERTSLLSSLKHETDIIGSNDTIIKKAFIPSSNILEFVAIFKNLALKNGLTQAFHFSLPTPGALDTSFPISTITYQNTISSTNLSSFINYLKEFEQLPYFTRIDSLSISSGQADWVTSATISFSATVAAQATQ